MLVWAWTTPGVWPRGRVRLVNAEEGQTSPRSESTPRHRTRLQNGTCWYVVFVPGVVAGHVNISTANGAPCREDLRACRQNFLERRRIDRGPLDRIRSCGRRGFAMEGPNRSNEYPYSIVLRVQVTVRWPADGPGLIQNHSSLFRALSVSN